MCTPLTLAIPRFTFSNKLFLLVINIAIVLELTAQALVFLSQRKLKTADQLITDRYLASTTSGSCVCHSSQLLSIPERAWSVPRQVDSHTLSPFC